MKRTIWFMFPLLIAIHSCKTDNESLHQLSVEEQIKADTLFQEWQTTKTPYWFAYVLSKVDKNAVSRTNALEVIHRVAYAVKETQDFYEARLFERYKGIDRADFRAYLESLYENKYQPVNEGETVRSRLRRTYGQYTKRGNAVKLMMSTVIPEVIITRCGIPPDLLDFYTFYIGTGQPLTADNEEQLQCMTTYLGQLATIINSLMAEHDPDPGMCQSYVSAAYDAMMGFFECDWLAGSDPEDPEEPGDPGDDDPPGGNDNGTQLIQAKEQILAELRRTECDAISLANILAGNPAIQSMIDSIKNLQVEWAAMVSTTDPEEATLLTVSHAHTDNEENRVNISPQWNSNVRFDLGSIHNHPNGGAPSPSDVFAPILNLNQMVIQSNITEEQFENYIDNFATIVVSGNYVYTISVKNPLLISYMKSGNFDKEKELKRYKDFYREYQKKNSHDRYDPWESSPVNQTQEAGEYALLKLYHTFVHITKHQIGNINSSEVLKLDVNNKVKKENPCQL